MSLPTRAVEKRGAEDAGRYFRHMADFVGFTETDAAVIRQTKPVIERHLADIVAKFYSHLLRYPQTRKHFLKPDGAIDHEYVELRMRHLTNFWLRTADGAYDDDYARYVDYVGRAHTSRGADPNIYIAERYVIGQVGFMQHAISEAVMKEFLPDDESLAFRAQEAWDKLMMVLLGLLARAYRPEHEPEQFEPIVPVDHSAVSRMAAQALVMEHGGGLRLPTKGVVVAHAAEIPDGNRKIVQVDGLSIGLFHHQGQWIALRNSCLHRGGPVATGSLTGNVLACPWHGFEYDITNGRLLVDPSASLDMYPVEVREGEIHLQIPDHASLPAPIAAPAEDKAASARRNAPAAALRENEFCVSDLPPRGVRRVQLNGQAIAVYNVQGTLYATQEECTHADGPLSEGTLEGANITCPWHGSCFDVTTGAVIDGPAQEPLKAFRVIVDGEIAYIEPA